MNRFPPKKILIAADAEPASLAALEVGKALSRLWGSDLEVVHFEHPLLITSAYALEGMSLPVPPPESDSEAVESRLRAAGLPADSLRRAQGWPAEVLPRLAARLGSALIVVGTHGYAGLERLLSGSVSEAVVRKSRLPVLVVPARRAPIVLKRVLCPWNGKPYAARALRYAREIARGAGAELVVMRVTSMTPGFRKEVRQAQARLRVILGPSGWRLLVRCGDARDRIMKEASGDRYGMVVLSAHLKPLSSDLVLGATAERLLRHCPVPVLAIPSGPRPLQRLLAKPAKWAAGRIF